MEKRIFLLKTPATWNAVAFKEKVFDEVVPAILALDPVKLKVGITEEAPPKLSLLPLRSGGLAMISLWGEFAEPPKILREIDAGAAGFLVEEAVPVAYEKTWRDGEVSPGATLLTLMKMNPAISFDDFMHEWHDRHTPLAMRIHPLWNYTRNVVLSSVIPGSPDFQGIVEEHFRSKRDALNPIRMFGGFPNFLPNMIKIARHVNSFLNIPECENYLLNEYHIRSSSVLER